MRILLIADTLAPQYGWGRYAIGLIRALKREGVFFSLLSPRHLCAEPDLRDLPAHGTVTSFVSETRRLSRLTAANALRIRQALQACDAVHCLTEPYSIPAALVAGRKPLLVTLHGTYAVRPFTRWRERPWYELSYRRATRLLPVSEFTKSLLPQRFQGPKTIVIPEGVDVRRFGGASGEPPAVDGQRPYVLSVGPIKRRKGYGESIEAFARVHAQRPDVEYRIVGGTDDPTFLAQLKQRIVELGIQNSVSFWGRVSEDDLVDLYRRCAAFWLLPISDDLQFEGFGLVYWEANACGRPIVGSRGSGAEDAIEDGVNGVLVPAGDPEAAAAAMLTLLDNPALATEMGQAGRQKVKDWGEAARLLIRQYQDLTGGGQASPQSAASSVIGPPVASPHGAAGPPSR